MAWPCCGPCRYSLKKPLTAGGPEEEPYQRSKLGSVQPVSPTFLLICNSVIWLRSSSIASCLLSASVRASSNSVWTWFIRVTAGILEISSPTDWPPLTCLSDNAGETVFSKEMNFASKLTFRSCSWRLVTESLRTCSVAEASNNFCRNSCSDFRSLPVHLTKGSFVNTYV